MSIRLGPNRYGKAEVRLVHVDRTTPRHRITDLTVSVALRGDFDAAHLTGDNAHVLSTDAQKNTVYALARDGVGEIEEFGLRLARHFAGAYPWITSARVEIASQGWDRIEVGGTPHDHAFVRGGASGGETRATAVTVENGVPYILSGLSGLTVLKSTGSEFAGFPRDAYTTLAETDDRILATAVTAWWRYSTSRVDFGKTFPGIRSALLETFASLHSHALQQTLYAMGDAVLTAHPDIAEIRLSMPNKHHFTVDLAPFGRDNPNVVFYAADRPYGLIQGTVERDDAPPPGPAWAGQAEFG